MIAANMAPYTLEEPHPLAFRIYGSFAAPTFVFLAGMMVGRSGPAVLGHSFRRAGELYAVAAAIDLLCWRMTPFMSFDVLYLIGLALPVCAACLSLPVRFHAALAVLVVLATPLVHSGLGYGPLLPDDAPWPAWRRIVVDGWFPVFPWLGVALLGAVASRLRRAIPSRVQTLTGVLLVLVGLVGLLLRPPNLVTRGGYSELFYPPTIRFLCVALGIVVLLLQWIPRLRARVPLGWLETYGRSSLFLYVAHTAVIAFVLDTFFERQPFPGFLALYFAHAAVMWGLAWLWIRALRATRST